MKKSKFSEEQIAYALRQAESGTAVADVCRQLGISEATFYVWMKPFAIVVIEHFEQAKTSPVAQLIVHGIHRPELVDRGRHHDELPRDSRRLQNVSGWSHGQTLTVFSRDPGARDSVGV